ncbi:IS66 family transposase, partial [Pseudomonas sp. NW5]|nr:IS66 family transposase [Pseudomonas sp. NW5]
MQPPFDHLTPEQLRALAAQLTERVAQLDQQVSGLSQQVHYHKTRNEQLAHEIAILKRHK